MLSYAEQNAEIKYTENLLDIFTKFMLQPFKDMQSLGFLLKILKNLLKRADFLQIQQLIDIMLIAASKGLRLDELQCRRVDEIFYGNFSILTQK